ncbi:MAG: TRAP transporter large permease subunit [Oscillospiraceae bacterium]|nr:TRAP transporter large permease subunit [Oscillospiraceae bacterium]
MTGMTLIGVFVLLLVSGIPVSLCLGISAVISVLQMHLPAMTLAINSNAALSKAVLEAIPFFILGGNIMERSGISGKLIKLASALVGHVKGGLIIVCVLCACFFAAISGSGPATVAALGTIIIPAMVSCGYSKETATGLTATAGGIGLIIPPSISYVVIAPLASISTGDLFLAGVFPGITMGIALIVAGLWLNRKNGTVKVLEKASRAERIASFKDAVWGLMMPVIILGGIYGGIFTATEAAAVSAVYGIAVGTLIYRSLSWKEMFEVFVISARQTAVVMLIIMCANLFAYALTVTGVCTAASNFLLNFVGSSKFLFLLIVNILFLIAGMLVDGNSAYYIFVPILLPVALRLGIDPVHLCVVMVMNIAIGLITPPVGANLYTACGITGLSFSKVAKACGPFLIASLIALILVTYIPQISIGILH